MYDLFDKKKISIKSKVVCSDFFIQTRQIDIVVLCRSILHELKRMSMYFSQIVTDIINWHYSSCFKKRQGCDDNREYAICYVFDYYINLASCLKMTDAAWFSFSDNISLILSFDWHALRNTRKTCYYQKASSLFLAVWNFPRW